MRRVRIRLLALLLSATACAGTPASSSDGPVLRVGTSGDYAPFSVAGEGFDVDVAERFARHHGWRLEWVSFRWPELRHRVASNDFDMAMSGITWTPERAVLGRMSRAVARGGPCLLIRAEPVRVLGVNRGGFLERWARQSHASPRIVTVADNTTLPDRLVAGEFDAIATDSFELAAFRRDGLEARCEPPRLRKVYWVSPARAHDLGPLLDAWLQQNEPALAELRARHFGEPAVQDAGDHLVDLLARRLAFMPQVAAWKRARGLPIEDRVREERVLAAARAGALERGLDPERIGGLARVQIALAKAVQERAPPMEPTLNLEQEIRPTLLALGDRIVVAVGEGAQPSRAQLGRLRPPLVDAEVERLERTLRR